MIDGFDLEQLKDEAPELYVHLIHQQRELEKRRIECERLYAQMIERQRQEWRALSLRQKIVATLRGVIAEFKASWRENLISPNAR